MTNFFKGLAMSKPHEILEVFFRLYYNADGEVTYSMEELEGDFLEITCEEFAIADRNVYVKDGKIHKKRLVSIGKLVPTSDPTGTDITLIDKNSDVKWVLKTYD